MSGRTAKLKMMLRTRAAEALTRALAGLGVTAVPAKRWDKLTAQRDRLFRLLLARTPRTAENSMHGVVFSMNRPLQLDGLLKSYANLVRNPAPLTVLYHTTTPAYARAYAEIAADHPGVRMVPQRAFRADLMEILSSLVASRVFFLTDDDVFIRAFDMAELRGIDPATSILSFRLGLNLDYCYPQARRQPLPPHTLTADGLVAWRWQDGALDWAYPASVDGHLFARDEIFLMAAASDFTAPNSFETALHLFSGVFADREGLCFRESRLVNVPANKVQMENANFAGNIAADWLLAQWEKGYRFDWPRLSGYRNRSAHEEMELPLTLKAVR